MKARAPAPHALPPPGSAPAPPAAAPAVPEFALEPLLQAHGYAPFPHAYRPTWREVKEVRKAISRTKVLIPLRNQDFQLDQAQVPRLHHQRLGPQGRLLRLCCPAA